MRSLCFHCQKEFPINVVIIGEIDGRSMKLRVNEEWVLEILRDWSLERGEEVCGERRGYKIRRRKISSMP